MLITSRDNSLLRQARAVRDGKIKDLIFVEGLRLCEEALRSSLPIEAVIFSDQIAQKDKAASTIAELTKIAKRSGEVSEKLLESVSYTKTPQGVVVLAPRPDSSSSRLSVNNSPLLVVMHEINNPVNVGAIIRTAEGAGATGAIATSNTSDPFSPKSLRGAMGSAFRLPIWTGPGFQEVIEWCDSHKIQTICADAASTRSFTEVDWTEPRALILGRESTGLSEEEMRAADHSVRIPMQGSVESLNVAVAAGVLLYEAARQRGRK
jgi:TrmH family RNA methyltransferase